MECNKWEELGLLFSANELETNEMHEYKEHLNVCDECRLEYDTYQKERAAYFTVEMLGGAPSKAVDDEILRVCSNAQKKVTQITFPFTLKKTVLSAAFFAVGFILVSYISFNVINSKTSEPDLVEKNGAEEIIANESSSNQSVAQVPVNDSSILDDAANADDSARYYSKHRGNLEMNGVVPVELKEEK